MANKRNNVAGRRAEAYETKARAWQQFFPRLQAVTSLADAIQLHANAASPDSPARSFYSNFGFFLHYSSPPDGANATELSEYLRILKCMHLEGALREGAYEDREAVFKAAIAARLGVEQ